MKHLKRKLFCTCLVFVLAIAAIFQFNFSTPVYGQESTANLEQLVKEYTDSDILYGEDASYTIHWYAQNYKNPDYFHYIYKIIPQELFLSNVSYSYMGKEYGFYIKTTSSRSELIVIDFDVSNIEKGNIAVNTDLENWYTMRILFQFETENNQNNMVLTENNTDFSLRSMKFFSTVENEHHYNGKDPEYDKHQDDGVIFVQSRMNYKLAKSHNFDFSDFWYGVGIAWDFALVFIKLNPIADFALTYVSSMFSINDYSNQILEERRVTANNEINISTEMSKEYQLNNDDISYLSKGIILTSDDNCGMGMEEDDYIQFITVSNDANQASRFNAVIQFELYDGSEKIGNEDEYFCFYSSETRYNSEIATLQTNNQYYMLENGTHEFNFRPTYSGTYNINSNNDDAQIVIDGVNKGNSEVTQYFEKNKIYKIGFYSKEGAYGTGHYDVAVLEDSSITISGNKDYIFKYVPASGGIFEFTFNGGLNCTIFDAGMSSMEEGAGTVMAKLIGGSTYYILLDNNTGNAISTQLQVNAITNNLYYAIDYNIELQSNQSQYYSFEVKKTGKYDINLSGTENVSVIIYPENSNSEVAHSKAVDTDFLLIRTNTLSKGKYYIRLSSTTNQSFKLNYNEYTEDYYWIIDGEPYTNQGITRGETHTLEIINANNERINKTIMVGMTYSDTVSFWKTSDGLYTFEISKTAKMYNDDLNYYCDFFILGDRDIYVEFPVIFYTASFTVEKISLGEFDDVVGVKIKCTDLDSTEDVTLHYKYKIDNSATYSSSVKITKGQTTIDMTKLPYYSSNYKFNIYFTVDYLEIRDKNSSTVKGIVYNSALHEEQINSMYFDSAVAGIHFESGTGTVSDPFIIEHYKQFNHISATIKNGRIDNYHFKAKSLNYWGTTRGVLFDCVFNGTLDGNKVSLFNISQTLSTGDVALFREIGYNGVVKNIQIYIEIKTKMRDNCMAATIALTNYGVIENCQGALSVSGSANYTTAQYLGGMVAKNYGTIKNCTSELNGYGIDGGQYIGGVAAYNTGIINNCTFSNFAMIRYAVKYTDHDCIGGIAGYNKGTVINCNVYGKIVVTLSLPKDRTLQPYIGGFIGHNDGGNFDKNLNYYHGTMDTDNLVLVTWLLGINKHNQEENVGTYIGYPNLK